MGEKRCYTVVELMEILGVGRQAVVSLLMKREFSWVKLTGGAYRISKGSFDRWLDQQNTSSAGEDDEDFIRGDLLSEETGKPGIGSGI